MTVLLVVLLLPLTAALPDVSELEGSAGYHSVELKWRYQRSVPENYNFLVTYCDITYQALGKSRCKKQTLKEDELTLSRGVDTDFKYYIAVIDSLRMSTNYSLEVTPVSKEQKNQQLSPQSPQPHQYSTQAEEKVDVQQRQPNRARAMREIVLTTKGFSARATNCLAESSVVEVETGPNFNGKISVEHSEDPACATEGDRKSAKTSYLLTINHKRCGSEILDTSISTIITVQENRDILTHSTRRFVVVCNYVPETFTVRAGVSLPNENPEDDIVPVDNTVFEVDPSELFDSTNNLFDSRLSGQIGQALRRSSSQGNREPKMWAHLVLMVILVMAAVVGLSCALWHFGRQARQRNRQGFMSPQEEPRAISECADLEAVVRDYTVGDRAPIISAPQVALTDFLTDPNDPTLQLFDMAHPDLCTGSLVDLTQGTFDKGSIIDMNNENLYHSLPPEIESEIMGSGFSFQSYDSFDTISVSGQEQSVDFALPFDDLVGLINPCDIPVMSCDLPEIMTPVEHIPVRACDLAQVHQTAPVIIIDTHDLQHHNDLLDITYIDREDLIYGTDMVDDPLPFRYSNEDSEGPTDSEYESDVDSEIEDGLPDKQPESLDIYKSLYALDPNWSLGDGDGQVFPAFATT